MRQSCPRRLRRDLHSRAQNPWEFRFHAPHSQNVAGASRRSAAPGSQVVGVAGYSDISSHRRASVGLPLSSLERYFLAPWLRAAPRKASRPGACRMHGAAGLQPPTCRFAVSRSQVWVGLTPRSRKLPCLLALCSERQVQVAEHRGVTRERSSPRRQVAGDHRCEEGA